ncbi:hypothetical protein PRECH8_19530 [Insulibacter thermoxylanivorax]|uniref:Uncharacterized protein n=1 Tax=Insulibacter thermoxylanivorax TaxID=2749268 RepID=A0A916QDD9_9BACL|nr:hypothetical protein [Insulibacter thermoxylanivorax]GFR38657.1 hypothetical protein PRECH8_19530 [Insulibacter thermoxylanivorax]
MGKIPFLVGKVVMQSNLEIEEVGDILSQALFGGIKFVDKELSVYDEVPAMILSAPILGFDVTLQGCKGFGEDEGYVLEIIPNAEIRDVDRETMNLDFHLTRLLMDVLKDHDQIKVLEIDTSLYDAEP